MRHGGWGERAARAWLSTAFDEAEVEEILADVDELAGRRRGLGGRLVRAAMIVRYPLLDLADRVRTQSGDRGGTMRQMVEDSRLVVRRLIRRPGFALTSIGILALGFGIVLSVHSLIKGVLLDPLPLDEPEQLVALWIIDADGNRRRMTPGNTTDVAELTGVFSHVAAFQRSETAYMDPDGGPPTILRGGAVTPGYLAALGVEPVLGRAFVDEDANVDNEAVVILGHHVWRQFFGADPDILGRVIDLGGTISRVVGIAPPALYPTSASTDGKIPFTDADQDFLRPLRYGGDYWTLRRPHLLGGIARLAPGVTMETASSALDALTGRLRAEFGPNGGETIVLSSLTEEVVGDIRQGLLISLLSVVLVFGIAAVNVGSLFLIREEDRRSDHAVVSALGAGPGRLLRQRVLEAALVCGIALVVGTVVSSLLIDGMKALVPYPVPRLADVRLSGQAVAVAAVLSAVLACLFGGTMGAVGRSGSSVLTRTRVTRPESSRLQSFLIGSQAALAVVVLVGALLLTRSFQALQSTDPGFSARSTWALGLHGLGYDSPILLDRIRGIPGVGAAAVGYDHPLQRTWEDGFAVVGEVSVTGDSVSQATIRPYGEGYFEAAGIPLIEGRLPDVLDHDGTLRMAVVNEAFRQRYLPRGIDFTPQVRIPSGDRRLGEGNSVFSVVGVVGDVSFLGPQAGPEPAIYVPQEHFAVPSYQLLIRPSQPGSVQLSTIRQAVHEVLPDVAVDEAGTLGDLLDQALARPRFHMMLLASLSMAALVLCTLGAYGIVARTVSTRRREIGIRSALGAAGMTIARTVAARALQPMVVGVVAGVGVSLATSQVLRALLFGLSPTDPVSLVGGPLLLLLVAGAGALVPALGALAVDPAETLRND